MSHDVLTESEYDTEVRQQAWYLQDAVDETGDKPIAVVVDVLDGHPWFQTGSQSLTSRDHGAIVGMFDTFHGNVENYRDPETLTEGEDFANILRKMAFGQFEIDVLTAYKQGDIEKPPRE